jgi:protein CpxP
MATKSTNKILVILVAVLLLTNLSMLYYFSPKKEETKSGSDRQLDWVKKELRLSDAQVAAYLELRHKRDSILKPLNNSLRESKLKIVAILQQPAINDSAVQALADEISTKQQPIEKEYFYHFSRIKAMCTPEQQALFDSVLIRMINRNTGAPQRDSANNKR